MSNYNNIPNSYKNWDDVDTKEEGDFLKSIADDDWKDYEIIKNMNKTAFEIVDESFEKIAKLNASAVKAGGVVSAGVLTCAGLSTAMKKHDEKKLKKDTSINLRRDVFGPGAKRTVNSSLAAAVPLAAATMMVVKPGKFGNYIKNKKKHVYPDLQSAKKGLADLNKEILKSGIKASGATYLGATLYQRDNALKDRTEKYLGRKATVAERVGNTGLHLLANGLNKPIKGHKPNSYIANPAKLLIRMYTPEAQVQARRAELKKSKKRKL